MNINEQERKQKSIIYRTDVLPQDLENVRRITGSTGFFHAEEIEVACELVDEHLKKGLASGYYFLFAELEGKTIGYSCFGPIPCTINRFDLYWIAVEDGYRSRGLGGEILRKSELAIADLQGERIYVETSSQERYAPTRHFYEKNGYHVAALLDHFYNTGDAKVIYLKVLIEPQAGV
jgi:ribosomal protein S18 acetylase RimI-like enzyme